MTAIVSPHPPPNQLSLPYGHPAHPWGPTWRPIVDVVVTRGVL